MTTPARPSPSADAVVDLQRYTRSELAHALIYIKGNRLNMDDYPMFKAIYDGDWRSMLLMTSRQVGKSTTLSGYGIIETLARPHFQTIFVTPSGEQTRRFSTLKVGKMIQYSPFVKKYFVGDDASNRVLLRQFSNGAEMAFSYAMEDADRVRGLSGDRACLDEYQDLLPDAIEPVIEECLRQSKHRYMMRCGTPKTNENAIQSKWEESTQSEWLIPCFGCNKWNAIRSEKYFSPKGPICKACGRLINPRHGKWVDFKPGAPIKGFHISRACMPESVPVCWNEGTRERAEAEMAWADVWVHLGGPDPYPISMFRNEVIGVSDSVGQRLVTIETLRKLCVAPKLALPFTADRLQGIGRIAVGIDWSGGGVNQVSRTVVAVVGLTAKGKKRLLYYKIFPGANPHDEFNEVLEILGHFDRLGVIGCDMGEGHMYSDMLRKTYGAKVKKIAYSSAGYYAAWNPKGEFLSVNRTRALDSLMMSFNTEEWEFPENDPGMEIVFADILAEYVEVTKVGNKVWRHSPTKPDDALHALSFARVAVQLATGELDLTAHPMEG